MAVYGKWNLKAKTFQEITEGSMTVNEDGTGVMEAMGLTAELSDIKVDGDSLSCVATGKHPKMGKVSVKVKADVDGDTIKGTMKMKVGGARFDGTRA